MDELPIVTRLQKADAVNFPIKTQELCYQAADRITELVEALREARGDILHWTSQRWSECEGSEDDLVGYIDAALAKALEASNE